MLKSFLDRIFHPDHPHSHPESLLVDRDGKPIREFVQSAVAVLLTEAAAADGAAARIEFDMLSRALQEHTAFRGRDPEDLTRLLIAAENQPQERERLFSEIRWRLNEDQRIFLAALAWEVILADQVITPEEVSFAARLQERLNLSGEAFAAAQQMAKEGHTHW